MKKVIHLLVVASFCIPTLSWGRSALEGLDQNGVGCQQRVREVAQQYLKVVDLSGKAAGVRLSGSEDLIVEKFEAVTPGSWDQVYIAEAKIKGLKGDKGAKTSVQLKEPLETETELLVKLKMTGDFDCDSLKVRRVMKLQINQLGGVERVD